MATDSFTDVFDSTTDAAFRSWGSRINTALAACGLVQTADTGQINWTTVTTSNPNQNEVSRGYEIWRFDDALQATKPVFLKLLYGFAGRSSNSPGGQPMLHIQVATATNGAGTLTGIIMGNMRVLGVSVGSTSTTVTQPAPITAIPCYFSGDGSYLTLALGVTSTGPFVISGGWSSGTNNAAFPAVFAIDRTRDTSGAITDHGLVAVAGQWAGSANSSTFTNPTVPNVRTQYLSYTTAAWAETTTGAAPFAFPGTGYATGVIGSVVNTWPLVMASPDAEPQCLATLGLYANDIASGTTFSVNVLGSTHTYLSCTNNASSARSQLMSTRAPWSVAVRYE